jgi:hypothetical protein
MIQLYSLMWILAVYFAIIGFMRGWNREIIATAGIALAMFTLFQFDALIRGTLLLTFPRGQAFFIQMAIFLIIVFFAYQNRTFVSGRRAASENLQASILGAIVGFFNGYLIGGTLWYFLDINEYPFSPYILAPPPGSPSVQSLAAMPMMILGGGVGGSGDMMVVAIVFIFLLVIFML